MVSRRFQLGFGVCYESDNEYFVVMEKPLIKNGAEIFRIDGGVEKAKFLQKNGGVPVNIRILRIRLFLSRHGGTILHWRDGDGVTSLRCMF